jgi:broad specificity phosphatase PhoE
MTADRLILVKHAMPVIVPDAPPRTWLLSDEGRLAAARLAEDLATFDPVAVVTSVEPKAAETGQIIAGRLELTSATAPGLHEHERDIVPFDSTELFHQRIQRLFDEPDRVVYGTETADAAHRRFERAVRTVEAAHPTGTLIIVAHGTVISLLVARANGFDPFPFWQALGLPEAVIVDRGTFRLAQGGSASPAR